MRYASIRQMDIVNGKGIGVSVFFQGCPSPHCKGCFNSSTWDFNGGNEWTKEVEDKFIKLAKKEHIDHISFLGGEPFAQPLDELISLVKRIKMEVDKPIWVWTGYDYMKIPHIGDILPYIDYIVDGQFVEELKDMNLRFRGSSNQRIWHKVNESEWKDITEQIDKNS
jgi:anaerobic ribonucleoside-triphosphate reductase activating protein